MRLVSSLFESMIIFCPFLHSTTEETKLYHLKCTTLKDWNGGNVALSLMLPSSSSLYIEHGLPSEM